MKRTPWAIHGLLGLTVVLWATPVWAEYGKTGWVILPKVQAAGPLGLPALPFDLESPANVISNPAYAGLSAARSLALVSELGFADDTLAGLIYKEPLGPVEATAGFFYYDAGVTDLNWMDGETLQTETVRAEQDLLGVATLGRRLDKTWTVGTSFKVMHSQLAQREAALAAALDAGVVAQPTSEWFISLALQNLGISEAFVDQTAPLPTKIYLGTAIQLPLQEWFFLPSASLAYAWVQEEWEPELALAIAYSILSLNAGYRFFLTEAVWQVGLGIHWQALTVGYAYVPGNRLPASHRLMLNYQFTGAAAPARAQGQPSIGGTAKRRSPPPGRAPQRKKSR